MKKLILLAIIAIITTSSCVTQKRCNTKFPNASTIINDSNSIVIKDSIVVRDSVVVSVKDSIVYTAAVKDSGTIDASQNHTYKFKSDKANVTIKIKDGKVSYVIDISATESRYNTTIKDLKSELEIFRSRDSISSSTVVIVKQSPIVRWYMSLWYSIRDFFAWLGLIIAAYFFVRFIIFKLILKTG